jgi:hypothetical protein
MHLATATLAVLTIIGLVVLRTRGVAPVRYLDWAAVGCLPWSLSVAATYHYGLDSAAPVVWMPSVAFTAGAVLIWARGFSLYAWVPSSRLLLLWLAAPAVGLAIRAGVGVPARAPLFVLNTVYSFGLLLAAAVTVARRSNDPDPAVRVVVRLVLAGAVGALVAEALRLQLTDTAAVVTIAGIAVVAARRGEKLWPRPHSEALLDDLGALVFVFDRDRRLIDLNAPARLFYSLRGATTPDLGTPAAYLLGGDPAELDAVTLELAAANERTRFSGYVQQLPSSGSPPHGWLVLLRRSTHESFEEGRRNARRASMRRIPTHDPDTGLPTERAFVQTLEGAAAFRGATSIPAAVLVVGCDTEVQLTAVATAIETAWEARVETVAIGRYGARGVALVVRDVQQTELETWADQTLSDGGVRSATRAGPLASVRLLVDQAAAIVPTR